MPNAPVNLAIVQTLSATEIQIGWDPGSEIVSNPVTKSYRVYLDDGSGNDPVLWHDSASQAISTVALLRDLHTGMTY